MTNMETKLAGRIRTFQKDRDGIALSLETMGISAVRLRTECRSLRQLAKITGLSPTYLSCVRAGEKQISMGAYIKIVEANGT